MPPMYKSDTTIGLFIHKLQTAEVSFFQRYIVKDDVVKTQAEIDKLRISHGRRLTRHSQVYYSSGRKKKGLKQQQRIEQYKNCLKLNYNKKGKKDIYQMESRQQN